MSKRSATYRANITVFAQCPKPFEYGSKHHPMLAWKIDRSSMYKALGLKPNGHIPRDFAFHGKRDVGIGSHPEYTPYAFEVRVMPSSKANLHRIHVRCPRCHEWVGYSKLHFHILSKRCLVTADANYAKAQREVAVLEART